MGKTGERTVEWAMTLAGLAAIAVGAVSFGSESVSPRESAVVVLLGAIAAARGAVWLIKGRK